MEARQKKIWKNGEGDKEEDTMGTPETGESRPCFPINHTIQQIFCPGHVRSPTPSRSF